MTNPEMIEKWRAEFIALLEKSQSYKPIFLHRADGVFLSDPVEAAWQGFLMARESVEIELLQSFTKTGAHMINQIVGHIEAQGYRVRGEE